MFPTCPTPPLKNYINLKEIPKKKISFKHRSYLGEFEAEFKKALACESGAQGEIKSRIAKSHDTVPLRYCIFKNCYGITNK
jgi:hypothetical protein